MADVRKKVIAIIAEQLAKPEDSISESSHFVDDLGADSLDTVEIIMAIEEAFSLEIPELDPHAYDVPQRPPWPCGMFVFPSLPEVNP